MFVGGDISVFEQMIRCFVAHPTLTMTHVSVLNEKDEWIIFWLLKAREGMHDL